MDAIYEKVREIIAVELQVEKERVVPDASLSELGMDSVSAINIVFAIQEMFGIEDIDVDQAAKIKTVADVGELIQNHLAKAGQTA